MAEFQVMPPLTTDEYAALVEDIRANGVRVPIDVDQHGRILDGHHRDRACRDLGITPPTRIVQVADDAAARDHAYVTNTTRRHLDRAQRRQVITGSLLADPGLSDRQHARRCGASPSTVATIRAELVASGQVSNLDTRQGADGKMYPQPASPDWRRHLTEPEGWRQIIALDLLNGADDGLATGDAAQTAEWLFRAVANVGAWVAFNCWFPVEVDRRAQLEEFLQFPESADAFRTATSADRICDVMDAPYRDNWPVFGEYLRLLQRRQINVRERVEQWARERLEYDGRPTTETATAVAWAHLQLDDDGGQDA